MNSRTVRFLSRSLERLAIFEQIRPGHQYSDAHLEHLNPDHPNNVYKSNDICVVDGRDLYEYMNAQDSLGKIHFGLRNWNYWKIVNMPVLTIGNCKFIFLSGNDEKDAAKIRMIDDHANVEPRCVPPTDLKIVTLDDGVTILDELNSEPKFGYDYESYGFPNDWYFKLVGVGLATLSKLRYIDFRYASSDAVRDTFDSKYKQFVLDNHQKFWCYNKAFEVNAFYRHAHVFVDVHDVMALCKCNNVTGTLKYTAQYYLRVGSWDDDLDVLDKMNAEVMKLAGEDRNFDFELGTKVTLPDTYAKLVALNQDFKLYNKYWWGPFAVFPTQLIGKYCTLDSFYTLMMAEVIGADYDYIQKL